MVVMPSFAAPQALAAAPALRPGRLEDAPDLARLEARLFDYDRISRRSFRRFIAKGAVLVVASKGAEDTILGYAVCLVRERGRTLRLYALARAETAPPGTGACLLRAAIGRARALNLSAVRLEVRPDNAAALRLYAKAGFAVTGRTEAYYDDGAPALRLRLDLEAAP